MRKPWNKRLPFERHCRQGSFAAAPSLTVVTWRWQRQESISPSGTYAHTMQLAVPQELWIIRFRSDSDLTNWRLILIIYPCSRNKLRRTIPHTWKGLLGSFLNKPIYLCHHALLLCVMPSCIIALRLHGWIQWVLLYAWMKDKLQTEIWDSVT